jgi:hypothetical protein
VRPWVIKQGDFLLQLANKFGFDADTVWQDPSNAQLRAIRPNPNILAPGDVLSIPDLPTQPPPMKSLAPGSTTTFVAPDPPIMTLTHKFVGIDPTTYASKAYTVQELDQLTGLESDANGVVTFQAPVTLSTATIVFTDTGESWALRLGAMDPMNTMSGIFMRLQGLGYITGDVSYDSDVPTNNLDVMRAALRALKAAQTSSGDGLAPASAPASAPAPDSAPPSGPPSSPGDDAGLADDGSLDTDTEELLQNAYGC